MKASELIVRLAVTPTGAAIDRVCVRYLDESPVSRIFAWSEGVQYNRPLLPTTTGRKSGQDRTVVLPYFDAGPGRIAIVGSRGGMPTDPHWALNLRANPNARIHVQRREQSVRTRLAEGEERAVLWKSISERSPVYAVYQKRAAKHREIPIFVIERNDASPVTTHAS